MMILLVISSLAILTAGSSKIVDENSVNVEIHRKKSCSLNSTCEPLRHSTCYGVKLPYLSTSLSLVSDISNQDEVQERLSKWKVAMNVPRCWAVIQPFLCSLYMPRCDGGLVDLPSLEMCEKIKYPCRIFENDTYWREELFKCDKYYQSKCKNNVRELKFNTTGQCKAPLVRAERETSYYEGVEGCGVQCHDPFYTEEEYQDIRTWVKYGAWLSFTCNLFAVLTFLIDWPGFQRYPTRVIFFMNVCFLLSSLGYVYQFLPWATEYTICHKDGTLRTGEPSIRENIYCGLNFVFVYYFLVAGIVWFNIFAYTWYIRLKKIDGIKNRKDKLIPYYHLTAWCLPFALTVIIVAFVGVDGDSLLGICFVGVMNKSTKIFLLGPLFFSGIGIIFFLMCIFSLIRLKITSDTVTSITAKQKICENIVRLLVFLLVTIFFDTIIICCHFYEFQHHQSWKESFRKYFECQLGVGTDGEDESCRMQHRPGAVMVQLLVIAIFGTHINVSTWLWTYSTMDVWSRFFRKLFRREVSEQKKLSKPEIIAKAYTKKNMLDSECQFSINIYKKDHDPVGIDFELNSVASNEFSKTWLDALPRLLRRRGAQMVPQNSESSSKRRSSIYSETSISVRRFSIESQRRNSCDSTVSVQAVEVTKTVRKGNRPKRSRKTRGGTSHKSSNLSQTINHLETEVLAVLNIGSNSVNESKQELPMILNNRRPAITYIDDNARWLLSMINSDAKSECSEGGSVLESSSS